MHAYCYASGQIEFGTVIPKGALPIGKGPDKPLRDFLSGVARHAYDGETLLVPGIPEAPDQSEALDALHRWLAWIAKGAPKSLSLHPARTSQ
jgi:hypothetical protein